MTRLKMKEPHEWHLVDDVMVTFTVTGDITDSLWNRFINDLNTKRVRVIFSCADNASISSSQRKATSEALQANNIYAVVVTNSRITRGMLTAISWLGGNLSGFSWDDLDLALAAAKNPGAVPEVRSLALGFAELIGVKRTRRPAHGA